MPKRSKWQSLPTEAINPRSIAIDQASTEEIAELMLREDRRIIKAVQREKERIAIAADLITEAFGKGGRLVFVGAGTSGRLGVLEAAEMPPTFSTPAQLVLAVMAGGREAFFKSRREQTRDNWRADYMAEAINDYFRAGYRAAE